MGTHEIDFHSNDILMYALARVWVCGTMCVFLKRHHCIRFIVRLDCSSTTWRLSFRLGLFSHSLHPSKALCRSLAYIILLNINVEQQTKVWKEILWMYNQHWKFADGTAIEYGRLSKYSATYYCDARGVGSMSSFIGWRWRQQQEWRAALADVALYTFI